MRDFFHSKLFIFTVAVLLLSFTLLIMSAMRSGEVLFLSRVTGVLFSPFQKGAARTADFFSGIYGYITEFDAMKEENILLKNKISEMEQSLRDAQLVLDENDTLRDLLELKNRNKTFDFEMGEIISVSSGGWGTVFTVDMGENDGVSLFNCVVTEQGMVGYISELGPTFAYITTLIDTDMRCGAIVSRSREVAVAEGSFDLMEQGFLKMSYLKKDSDILTGDTVETSGLGGLFPKGLLIGTVERIATESHGISNFAVIRPAVNLDEIRKVFIIKSFSVQD